MFFHFVFLLALAVGAPQSQKARIGTIEFFGTSGIDVHRVRSLLPVREGDEVSEDQVAGIRDRINQAVANAVGHRPTDIAVVCCNDQQNLMIYIGLGGSSTGSIPILPAPKGLTCLPRQALALYDQAMAAVEQAAESGNAGEDDSRGYALANDPTLRAKQLAMHEYALTHERTLERALQVCKKAEHRRAAAEILGYARKSVGQIRDLVRASRDSDQEVRNNAVRALGVLAMSSPKTAAEIPADNFVEMLNSGNWHDRNKSGLLLMSLTGARRPQLLKRLRAEALPSLIEMARWQDSSHAYAYKTILGRIAGFDEARIEQLIHSGKVGEIIAAAGNRP